MGTQKIFDYKIKTEHYDYLAPDKSEIRLMAEGIKGNHTHCDIRAVKTALAVKHRNVQERCYILSG